MNGNHKGHQSGALRCAVDHTRREMHSLYLHNSLAGCVSQRRLANIGPQRLPPLQTLGFADRSLLR